MKKIFLALAVAALLTSAVYAEPGTGNGNGNSNAKVNSVSVATASASAKTQDRAQARDEDKEQDKNQTRNQTKNQTKLQDRNQTKLQDANKTKIQNVKAVNARAVQSYQKARENYASAKQNWTDAKAGYNKTKTRLALSSAVSAGAKYMAHTGDVIVSYLDGLQNRINASNLNETEKEALMAQIQTRMEWFQNKSNQLENVTNRSDLMNGAKQVREELQATRRLAKKAAGLKVNARVNSIIGKAEKLALNLQHKIDILEQQGYNVSVLEDLLDEYLDSVDAANESFVEAADLLEEDEPDKAYDAIKEAHRYLTQAHQTLQKMVQEFRRTYRPVDAVDDGFEGNETEGNETEGDSEDE